MRLPCCWTDRPLRYSVAKMPACSVSLLMVENVSDVSESGCYCGQCRRHGEFSKTGRRVLPEVALGNTAWPGALSYKGGHNARDGETYSRLQPTLITVAAPVVPTRRPSLKQIPWCLLLARRRSNTSRLSPIKPHHLRGQYVLQFAKLLQRDFTDSDVCKVARFRPCTKSCVAPACRLKGGMNGFPHSRCSRDSTDRPR
jgi:hypothetical protein